MWAKYAAPSSKLRKWFDHDPERWEEFKKRYADELDRDAKSWKPILELAGSQRDVLLYGSRETSYNNAVALKDYLEARLK